jgi:hypothetical protein
MIRPQRLSFIAGSTALIRWKADDRLIARIASHFLKSLIQAVAIAAALVAPVVSFAQSNTPITRAQVRAELEQLEKAGYRPGNGDSTYYPEEIQAAEALPTAGQRRGRDRRPADRPWTTFPPPK